MAAIYLMLVSIMVKLLQDLSCWKYFHHPL